MSGIEHLQAIPAPAPPGWEEAVGYTATARFLALAYEFFSDGRLGAAGAAADY